MMSHAQPGSQEASKPRKGYTITSSGVNDQVNTPPMLPCHLNLFVHSSPSKPQTLTSCLSQGNHYCVRDYTPSTGGSHPNHNTYHYSNTNGSYYYSNPDGSTYFNNGDGAYRYSKCPGESYSNYGNGAYAYDHADGSSYYNDGEGYSSYIPPAGRK